MTLGDTKNNEKCGINPFNCGMIDDRSMIPSNVHTLTTITKWDICM